MPGLAQSFTHDRTVLNDGTVAFKCSSDDAAWPWLSLPWFHPVTVQSINFFASTEASREQADYVPDKWSALTKMSWQCGDPAGGPASHGIFEPQNGETTLGYTMTFFDATGALAYRMSGEGVVFRTRNFEAWRSKDKPHLEQAPEIEYASNRLLGVQTGIECFLSPKSGERDPFAIGFISAENGLPPAHPYLDGSGDHVNSTHLVEASRQFVSLLKNGAPFNVRGGEMTFSRYVELGRPFKISRTDSDSSPAHRFHMSIQQSEKVCATVILDCNDA